MLNICLYFSYKRVTKELIVGGRGLGEKALEKVSGGHYPNVILFLIVIHLVIPFILLHCYGMCYNSNKNI